VLGTRCGTSIYDLTTPSDPILVAEIPGAAGVWRDMKNWGDHIYVVADQGSFGIQVINMSNPDEVVSWQFNPFAGADTMKSAHNLYIDSLGLMYVAGSELNGPGGVVIFSLPLDDSLPPIVGYGPAVYAHDVYVNEARSLMITSDIYNGSFGLHELDRSEVSVTATTIASQETAKSFTHNTWTSEDGNTVFSTDEVGGAFVEAWDISDLNDIIFLDRYSPFSTLGSNVTPHNVHVKGNHLIISYYRDGIKIVDASRPTNLVEVAGFDTEPGNGSGCWGAFPFFDSDLILASDINNGLFVLQPNYTVQPAYLEGIVKTADGSTIDSAKIQIIIPDSTFEYSKHGVYALGIVDQTTLPETEPGVSPSNTVQVIITKEGYEKKDTTITLVPGIVVSQDFVLTQASLPVELISFSVSENGCKNRISWQVGSVVNHSHFEIQKSQDGINFKDLKSIYPSTALGNSYLYEEIRPDAMTYYRLNQIDEDGTSTYSQVIFIENNCIGTSQGLTVSPNPVQSFINVTAPVKISSAQIIDFSGRLIMQLPIEELNDIDVSHLAPGIYYLKINASDQLYFKKLLKIK
jgi:choice-of-anchor B domain-containing protein